jgi:hypothetical protein
MGLNLGRALMAAIAIEVLSIGALLVLVALLGPNERVAAEAFANELGRWVGPIAGALFSLAGSWWVARTSAAHPLANGVTVGVMAVAGDVPLIGATGNPFRAIYVLSGGLRILAGAAGGWNASIRRTRVAPADPMTAGGRGHDRWQASGAPE